MADRLRLPRISPRRVARSPWFPWALFGVALALAVTFFALWRGERSEENRADAVLATAGGFLRALTNFSGETIDVDVDEIRSYAIGEFAAEVDETFSPERIQALREGDATSTGEIESLAIQSIGEESATVFGVVNETITNRQTPVPRTDVLRVEVGLIETANGWKVHSVEILQSPQEAPLPA